MGEGIGAQQRSPVRNIKMAKTAGHSCPEQGALRSVAKFEGLVEPSQCRLDERLVPALGNGRLLEQLKIGK